MIENFDQLKELLSSPKQIAITTHQNPDGDAMGSSLALMLYLRKKGHQVYFISPTTFADFYKWMPGCEETIIYPYNNGKAKEVIDKADVFFCLDFNAQKRVGPDMAPVLEASTAVKVVIDHHLYPDDFPNYLYSRITASSTAEMVYDFIELMGDEALLDKEIGTNIYTGILTDTGAFQFPSTSAHVHRIAAALIDLGVENSYVYQQVFNSYTEMRLRLLGYCIDNMKVYPELHTALITLNRDELQRFQVKSGDTEGIVNYPLKIQGINFSAFITDRTEQIKMSFRSVGSFDVNAFARNHFNGGGHMNAAGGSSKDTLQNVIKLFEENLPKYKDNLNY